MTASQIKKASLSELMNRAPHAQGKLTEMDAFGDDPDALPVTDNSSFLTPRLQEVIEGLTALEQAVLVAHLDAGMECNGAETLDAMRADNMTWSDVAETSKRTGLTKKQVNGVLSSL